MSDQWGINLQDYRADGRVMINGIRLEENDGDLVITCVDLGTKYALKSVNGLLYLDRGLIPLPSRDEISEARARW